MITQYWWAVRPLNEEFGKAIGADAYCRDAAVAVETAKEFMARKTQQLWPPTRSINPCSKAPMRPDLGPEVGPIFATTRAGDEVRWSSPFQTISSRTEGMQLRNQGRVLLIACGALGAGNPGLDEGQ